LLALEHGQAHAHEVFFGGAAQLRLDVALHALAHRIGFALDLERTLSGRGRVFAADLPGALGHRLGRGPVGEHGTAVGIALLVDLRGARRVGDGGARDSAAKTTTVG
jgi:hypothetical protein